MVCVLPTMMGRHRLRAWLSVMASSLLALLVPHLSPVAYFGIDMLCGAMVLARPAGCAQRAIGMLFACMAVFDIAYWVSPQIDRGELYYWGLMSLGWAQWTILAVWGFYDTGKVIARRAGFSGRQVVGRASIG